METRDMIRMANQIADFFRPYPRDEAVAEVATHLRSFWTPAMRAMLFDHVGSTGGDKLDPLVVAAVARLTAPAEPA